MTAADKQATKPIKSALVIQGSPRPKKSWTAHCTEYLVSGLEKGGVAVDQVRLKGLDINHCLGCFACWHKTPGQCIQKDDQAGLLERMVAADLWVMATPLYYYSTTGLFKNFLDRTLPLAQPEMHVDKDGLTDHPSRHGGNKRVVLVSACGFPELDHFRALKDMFSLIYGRSKSDRGLVGCLFRPAAEGMTARDMFRAEYDSAMAAFERAGTELAEQGRVDPATEAAAAAPFFDPELYRRMANQYAAAQASEREK